MTTRDIPEAIPDNGLQRALEQYLVERHGLMISGEELRKVLAYSSQDAFRQALKRGRVPVPVFSVEHRRGKFALSRDVAHWIAAQRVGKTSTVSMTGEVAP